MKKPSLLLSVVGLSLAGAFFVFMAPSKTSAVTASDWIAGRIIDDAVFFNKDAMSVGQIQAFLNAKVPVCDTWGTQYTGRWNSSAGRYYTRAEWGALVGNPAPFTCLKDYRENPSTNQSNYSNPGASIPGAISAAQIIWNAAQQYGINPQVLIVTLQKEQGLVTDDWPYQRQYTYAMGANCPDTPSGCDPAYSGFATQMNRGAYLFNHYKNNINDYNYNVGSNYILWNVSSSGCGGGTVNIQNIATAMLYIYTPYQPNQASLNNMYGTGDGCSAYGNRNFWRYFNDWFGSPTATFLLRGSSPTVYLAVDGKKYAASAAALSAYGFSSIPVNVTSDSYLAGLEDNGLLTTLFQSPGDATVYLADNGHKIAFTSMTACTNWGMDCGSATAKKILPISIANLLPYYGTLQPLMNHKGTVYKLSGGEKEPLLSPNALFERGYSWANVTPIASPLNAGQPAGAALPQKLSFVRFAAGPSIYFYDDQDRFFAIKSYNAFKGWLSASDKLFVEDISKYNDTPPTTVGELKNVVAQSGKTYLLDNGRRIDVSSTAAAWPAGTSYSFAGAMMGRLSLITVTPATTFKAPDGTIYRVNADKDPFFSMADFYGLGYSLSGTVSLSADNLALAANGKVIFAPAALLKTGGSPTIYVAGIEHQVFSLANMGQLSGLGLKTASINDVPGSYLAQQTIKAFPYLISDAAGTSFLLSRDTKKFPYSSSQAAAWGVPLSLAESVGTMTKNMPAQTNALTFARASNGTIYKGVSGSKRPISSYATYLSLGGNAGNTFEAGNDFLGASPTGPSL